jgi:hypothetical protein
MSEGVYRVRPPRPLPRRFVGTARVSSLVPRRPLPVAALRRDHRRRAHRPLPRRLFAGPRPTGASIVLARRPISPRRPAPARRDALRQQHPRRWIGSNAAVAAVVSLALRRPTPVQRHTRHVRPAVRLRRPWAGARPVRASYVIARKPTTTRHLQLPGRSRRVPIRHRFWVGSVAVVLQPLTTLREYVNGLRPGTSSHDSRPQTTTKSGRPPVTTSDGRPRPTTSDQRPDPTVESTRRAR